MTKWIVTRCDGCAESFAEYSHTDAINRSIQDGWRYDNWQDRWLCASCQSGDLNLSTALEAVKAKLPAVEKEIRRMKPRIRGTSRRITTPDELFRMVAEIRRSILKLMAKSVKYETALANNQGSSFSAVEYTATGWRKDPQRHLDAPRLKDPDTCEHKGGRSSYDYDGVWITYCEDCGSTYAHPRKPRV